VTDPTGPTPSIEEDEIDTVKLEDIPELQYDPDKHPISHQPWRRGETAGCEDPIDAEWRQKAEEIMRKAVEMTGGTLIDVTWFLTYVLVTIDDDWEQIPRDYIKAHGPVIDIQEPQAPMYKDPADPNPEDIWADEEDVVYQKDEEVEQDIGSKMYARQEEGEEDLGLDEKEDVPLYATQESREDDALRVAEEAEILDERQERAVDPEAITIDTASLSLIAGAILDALETVEDELQVLDRHEVLLASPGLPDVVETQSQFDAYRGYDVAVATQDPWDSKRTLRGKLVDRNSMDVIINQKGRMVTIPLNFVECVRLPQAKRDLDADMEEYEGDDEQQSDGEDIYED
jgi:ribosome maturation factor RimP